MKTENLGKLKATCFKMTLTKCNNVWLFVSVHSAVQILSIGIKKKMESVKQLMLSYQRKET